MTDVEPDYTAGATGDGWGGLPYVRKRSDYDGEYVTEEEVAFMSLSGRVRASAVLSKLSRRLSAAKPTGYLLTPYGRRTYDMVISEREFADLKYGHDCLQVGQIVKDTWIISNLGVDLRIHYVDDAKRKSRVSERELDTLDFLGIPWKVWGPERTLLFRQLELFKENSVD